MDPYIQKNMENYMMELQRIFPKSENEGTRNIRPSAEEQFSSSLELTSPEGPVPSSRRADTPYWPKEPAARIQLADYLPLRSHPPPGRCVTKSTTSTDSASPDSIDLSIIRRPGVPFTNTWTPRPIFRKITKTYDRPVQPPPLEYQTPPTPVNPQQYHSSFIPSEYRTFPQALMSPEFYTPTRSPMSPLEFSTYPTLAQSPLSTSTRWSMCAPGSCYSSTPQGNMSLHDGYVQSVNDSGLYTPHRPHISEEFLTNHSAPCARYDETLPPFLTPPKVLNNSLITDPIHPELKASVGFTIPHRNSKDYCHFCRKNGESPQVYYSHQLKVKKSKKIIVTCPILRSLVCSTCGASGDNAHTSTYCPVVMSSNNGQRQKSATVAVKSTRIKSNGKHRY